MGLPRRFLRCMNAKHRVLLASLAILALGLAFGQSRIAGPMPAEDGEICIVCYGRTTKTDVAYVVDGQRYAVMKGLEDDFLKQPDEYIRKFKAHQKTIQPNANRALYGGLGLLVVVLSAAFWWLDRRRQRAEGAA